MQGTPLPAEVELLALAGRFDQAERRLRALLAQAVDGDRRTLLAEALAILHALRLDAQGAGAHVEAAYAVSATAAAALTGRPAATGARAADLGRSLASKLDRGVLQAEQGARHAFATVRSDTLAEAQTDAVTALVDRAGNRRALGQVAGEQVETVGRAATTRGVTDTLGPDGQVRFSSHGTRNPLCKPHEGREFTVATAPKPPLHPRCGHRLQPVSVSDAAYVAAQQQARKQAYAALYAGRRRAA